MATTNTAVMRYENFRAAWFQGAFQPGDASWITRRPRMVVVIAGVDKNQPPAVNVDEMLVSGATPLGFIDGLHGLRMAGPERLVSVRNTTAFWEIRGVTPIMVTG